MTTRLARFAIQTRYHGPTETQGSRITATARGMKITVPYDHALSGTAVHLAAARALLREHGLPEDAVNPEPYDGTVQSGWIFTVDGGQVLR